MIYEHKCQYCENIVEREKKTGLFSCFSCKRTQVHNYYVTGRTRKNTTRGGTSSV